MEIVKKVFSILLRISISVLLLIFLFRHVDIKSLVEIIKKSDKSLLSLACGVFFFNYILCFIRWRMLLITAGIILPLKRVLISFCGGIFFSLFLPSTIGGDFVRSIDLSVHTKKPSHIVATVILDRLSGFIALVTVSLTALFLGRGFIQNRSVFLSMAIITGVLLALLLVLFNTFCYAKINALLQLKPTFLAGRPTVLTKIRELLKDTHQQIHLFRTHRGVIALNLGISLIIQLFSPVIFYLIALSVGIKINILYFFVFTPIIGAITLLPISIGGLGLRDATTVFFFLQAGVAKDLAFAMSLLNFFLILFFACLGGLVYVLTVHYRRV